MYLTCGSLEYEKYQSSFENLDRKLTNESVSDFKWKIQVNEGRNHHTSAYAALIDGLVYYFNEVK